MYLMIKLGNRIQYVARTYHSGNASSQFLGRSALLDGFPLGQSSEILGRLTRGGWKRKSHKDLLLLNVMPIILWESHDKLFSLLQEGLYEI